MEMIGRLGRLIYSPLEALNRAQATWVYLNLFGAALAPFKRVLDTYMPLG